MNKIVGYSFWGFLADVKMDSEGNELSTPDGNAFYSWSIIRELANRGCYIVSVMPNRDVHAVAKLGKDAFKSWCCEERFDAYTHLQHLPYSDVDLSTCSAQDVFRLFDRANLKHSEYIIHEWRMEIPSRNDLGSRGLEGWQPDLFLQECLIEYCAMNDIKLVIFDLDYKLSVEDAHWISDIVDLTVIELGDKWKSKDYGIKSERVEIPFCFDQIYHFEPKLEKSKKLVYVGNRYERDWCIDKYFPKNVCDCVVYGNWNESGRDSKDRWPMIDFRGRLQTSEMHDAYSDSACTILLAKRDYCMYGFMTARIIESVFYGAVPLFIEEFGEEVIDKYAGSFAPLLTVKDEEDVIDTMEILSYDVKLANNVIQYLREHLKFMDAKHFVDKVEEAIDM